MNINIGDYQVESDSLQFIVKEKKIRQDGEKKGEPYFVNVAYCCKFEEVAKFIPNEVLRTNGDVSIIIEKLDQIQADIQALEYKPVIYIKPEKVKDESEEIINE